MAELEFFTRFFSFLQEQPVFTFFFILGVGYLIGNIRFGSFSFGPVAGVLFIGLFLGHFDFRIPPGVQSIGFALFIFSVGYQAGPRFFDVLRTDGLRYFLLAVVIAATGFLVALIATKLLSLSPGTSAGLLAGGLTSSPTLAAAQEAIRSGQISPPAGMTADEMIGNVATGYAITYIFGLAGLIAIIKLLPQFLGIDLAADAKEMEKQEKKDGIEPVNPAARGYLVSNPEVTKTHKKELKKQYWDHSSVSRVVRDGKILEADSIETLRLGDEVYILAPTSFFVKNQQTLNLGKEISPKVELDSYQEAAQVVVINPKVIGKSPHDLDIAIKYGVLVTSLVRMRMEMPLTDKLELCKGDILNVVGAHENVDKLGKEIGHVEREIEETDMVTFCFGISLGVIIGLFAITVGQFKIGLGSAGGLLTAGLLIGYLRSVNPTFGRLPDAARWILMEFGLLTFMAGVGLRAGGNIIETFLSTGPLLIIAGISVTTIPILVGYVFGRKVLKIPPVLLLGGITGSMTSGASLSVVTKAANSSVPSLGYTGAYAFANVLLTIAGSIILLF